MWVLWIQLAIIAITAFVYFLYTVVFWFWFIYLVDAIKRKRGYYNTALRCLESECDEHQQALVYNAKTELVKFVSLFYLNLIEWIGFAATITSDILNSVRDYQLGFLTNHTTSGSVRWYVYYKLHLPDFQYQCLVHFMAILGSLCIYLSARYAHKRWITSKRIPYWICFFVLSSIASQTLIIIPYSYIIGMWCDRILVALSVIFVWKQYRKLNMVLQWSIVDLRVSGDIELLEKHVRTKRRFNRMFTTILIGVSCILVASLIDVISHTTQFILPIYNHSFTDRFPNPSKFEPSYTTIVSLITESIVIVGFLFFFIPYIGYGFCTMYVLLWRLFKGKTGYRTHFPVHLTKSLI